MTQVLLGRLAKSITEAAESFYVREWEDSGKESRPAEKLWDELGV